jgi:ubiquinone/menaquinone biosynthesis C-methylase UbiE
VSNQSEFFNSMAEKWDVICNHDIVKIEKILNFLDIKPGAKILDVGTGTGILIPFLVELSKEHGEITAIDVSYKMLEIAQQKYPYENVSYVFDDVLEANLPNEHYDLAICYSVFPHFVEKQSAIQAISKYLKIGGKLMICHSQSRDAINNLHKNISDAVSEDDLPPMDVIKGYFFELGFKTNVEKDNDEMFVIVGIKD